jgi:CheY-like chemotaxis protein
MRARILLLSPGDPLIADWTSCFTAAGYEVVVPGSPAEALDTCANNPPDLVVTFHPQPARYDQSVTRHLKRNPGTWHIPVVAAIRSEKPGAVARAYRDGADLCIARMRSPESLRTRIEPLLSARAR